MVNTFGFNRTILPLATITTQEKMKLMTTKIQLEPEAQAFADANAKPPFLFEMGVEKGRAAG